MSVAHADDADDYSRPTGETYHAEKALPSGDFYTGQWRDNLPHGHGKYLWTDGCMYVGEWHRGKTMGKGRFSWPSGATYEGDFKNGYMDGKGTYIDSTGDLYRGSWVMNLRHGQGTKSYVNGDCYDGEWRRGLQDGHGRYQWKNENHYIGQWKNGMMNGNGTMIWSNGNRYDGSWEESAPKGNGTFRWSDGSFYVGVWSKDPKEQNGTYYPSTTSGNFDWQPQQVFYVDLSECVVCTCQRIPVLPSQKMPVWYGSSSEQSSSGNRTKSSERPRRRSVDGRISNGEMELRSNGSGYLQVDDNNITESNRSPSLGNLRIQPAKKQGQTISKGHKNYDLMLNLQLGIRHSVGRPAPATSLDLKASAFDPKEKVWTKFPSEGSKYTPPHQSCEFKWKDYCPVVFRTLRKLFSVDAADYMLSICGNDALRELSSPGKSGSFFYLTNDDRYMIKTMKKAETKVLIRMLPAYYNHVRACENTLVTKFFGLHCVKLTGTAQKKVRFVIMGNLFCTGYSIHRRFDLKGSSHGRLTTKPESEIDPNTTLKDLDLNFIFRLQKNWFQEFCRQVDRDCEFLEQERIMDYSLLVGLHFREAAFKEPATPPSGARTPTGNSDTRLSRAEMDRFLLDASKLASTKLGINMSTRVERTVRRSDCENQLVGEPTGEFYDYDPTSISAVDPKQYSRRFRDFIFKIFVEDT
ncbi:hypothetical protein AALP_AA3G088600 [Arabis alpina]|uniref:Phosphatidylinositol 4-phosphate 5-kinase n=1 Tax=Arabis alpina TaxID=50452 RepID=A0A087H7Z6_ARAAL|nr:hypothetical protein AALP_AA3G088600 [Arabis alpina]